MFYGISNSVFINSTISMENLKMDPWLGNIGLNSGKVSLKVMLFILTSNGRHIIDIIGRSEDIQENNDGIKTYR